MECSARRRPCVGLGIILALCLNLAIGGCSVNDLLIDPDEARATQAVDPVDPAINGDVPREISVLNRTGHKLTGWLFASEGDRGTVLVAGGNGMGTPHTYLYNRFLLRKGFRVLVFSYQGFDQNEGEADIGSVTGDAEAFRAFVAAAYPGEPIGFVGESIGAIAGLCSVPNGYDAMALEGLVDPKSVAYSIVYANVPAPLSYVLSFVFGPIAAAYEAAVPSELDASECAARHEQTELLFLNQRNDPVSSFELVQQLMALRPDRSALVVLPNSAEHPHLEVTYNRKAQDRILALFRATFGRPIRGGPAAVARGITVELR
jgi:hypothetical protein